MSSGLPSERLRIVVMGCLVRVPLGGITWHYIQYVSGLMRLGHEVLYVEDSDDYKECCYDPTAGYLGPDPAFGLSYVHDVFATAGLEERWAYYDAHDGVWRGPGAPGAESYCRSADILLNISGSCPIRPWLEPVPVRAYVDTDPAFEQVRQVTDAGRRELADAHNNFFTFGENIPAGVADCPDGNRRWKPTRQPIDLRYWPSRPGKASGSFTTILKWDSYATRELDGKVYGMKSHSMRELMDLPARTGASLELAVGGDTTPYDDLEAYGWRVAPALEASRDPWTYRAYIAASKGEFSVAKHGYVTGRTGWFSERSACYLATGRPVVAQDTGAPIPAGAGLLTFSTWQEASEALDAVAARYEKHCHAARQIAMEYFDSNRVLAGLLSALEDDPGSADVLVDHPLERLVAGDVSGLSPNERRGDSIMNGVRDERGDISHGR